MSLQHVVLFSFPTELSDDDWADMQRQVRSWPAEIGGIDAIRLGPSINTERTRGYQYLLYTEFTDVDALVRYQKHPVHQKLPEVGARPGLHSARVRLLPRRDDRRTVTPARTSPRINHVARQMPRSGIREVMDAAWGRPDVIHLEVGEPDFATPSHVVEAAHRAVAGGATHYTPTAGVPELRERLAEKVSRRDSRTVDAEQMIATHGGVAGIDPTLQALTEPGDEVLLPDPAWPNFLMMANLLRLEPRLYPLRPDAGFVPLVDDVERLVSPRTRVLLLNSPSNPLGAVISPERTRELTELAERHDLWVLSDECYDELVFADDGFTSPAPFAPDRVVTVGSFSKTYAMTGWRIGYITAPHEVATPIIKCMEPLLSCANTPAQMAAITALDGPQTVVTEMRDSYRARRDAAVELLKQREQPLLVPDGAFYLWVDISESGLPSRDFALRLLEEHSVAVAPGTAFGGGEGYVRVSLATAQAELLEGLQRLTAFTLDAATARG